MTFTVQQQDNHFNVIGYDMIIASFHSEQSATEEAARMNDEYERVLEIL